MAKLPATIGDAILVFYGLWYVLGGIITRFFPKYVAELRKDYPR